MACFYCNDTGYRYPELGKGRCPYSHDEDEDGETDDPLDDGDAAYEAMKEKTLCE